MGFLAGIVPGFRELRNLLISGILWITDLDLFFDSKDQLYVAHFIRTHFGGLRGIVGHSGIFASVLFAAFLIGTLLLPISLVPAHVLGGRRKAYVRKFIESLDQSSTGSRWKQWKRFHWMLRRYIAPIHDEPLNTLIKSIRHESKFDSTVDISKIVFEIVDGIYKKRLPTEFKVNPDLASLHDEVDRKQYEAEERFALSFPVLLLFIAIGAAVGSGSVRTSLILAGMVAFCGLYIQGLNRRSESISLVVLAVAENKIVPIELEYFLSARRMEALKDVVESGD